MTKRPISSISFNSERFLNLVCFQLVDDGLVQSFMFVKHKPEEDTKKEHFHLILVPSFPVNPVSIRKRFIEPCPEGDLGCLPFNPSKLTDWLLYSIHYPPYLLRKGLNRQYFYSLEDVVSNESIDFLDCLFNESVETMTDSRIMLFVQQVESGRSFCELLASGLVPPNQVVFYDKLFKSLTSKCI